jgi:hypothetical protein
VESAFRPNVRRRNTEGKSDMFLKREETCWTSDEETERDMRSEQAGGLDHDVEEEMKDNKDFALRTEEKKL